MPQPEGAGLNFGFSPILTNVGLNLLPKLDQFIVRKIAPPVSVASPSGVYNFWTPDDFLRRDGKIIANYEAVPIGGFASTQLSFTVQNFGAASAYTARDLADARRGGTSDQALKNAKTRWVVTKGLLELEFRGSVLFQTAANWTSTVAGVTSGPSASQFIQWDQAASSPVDDILLWKRNVRLLTGYEPNTLVIPDKVWLALRKNTSLIDRIKYGGTMDRPTEITLDQLKALFEIQNIYVPKGVYNSAAEGATAVFADIWTTTVWMGYVAASPGMQEPSAAYNFSWTGDTSNGLPAGMGTGQGPQSFGSMMNEEGLFLREYIDAPRSAVVIEGTLWTTPNVVSAGLGMTFTAPIA